MYMLDSRFIRNSVSFLGSLFQLVYGINLSIPKQLKFSSDDVGHIYS